MCMAIFGMALYSQLEPGDETMWRLKGGSFCVGEEGM